MSLEAKEIAAGLAIVQDGKRVELPKSGNYAVRPVAGGPYIKANGQDVIKDLAQLFPGCVFLWLSKAFEVKAANGKDDVKNSDTKDPKKN